MVCIFRLGEGEAVHGCRQGAPKQRMHSTSRDRFGSKRILSVSTPRALEDSADLFNLNYIGLRLGVNPLRIRMRVRGCISLTSVKRVQNRAFMFGFNRTSRDR